MWSWCNTLFISFFLSSSFHSFIIYKIIILKIISYIFWTSFLNNQKRKQNVILFFLRFTNKKYVVVSLDQSSVWSLQFQYFIHLRWMAGWLASWLAFLVKVFLLSLKICIATVVEFLLFFRLTTGFLHMNFLYNFFYTYDD